MKGSRKDWFMFLSILLLLSWAIGSIYILYNSGKTSTDKPSEPRKVKFLMRTGAESEAMSKLISPFEKETGVKVEVIELGRDGYFTSLATQLFAGSGDFDVAFIPSTYVAQFAKAKAILPLDPFIADAELTDPQTFDKGDFVTTYPYNDQIYALPTDISTHFLYYRSDLIQHPPETWDELLNTARTFTKDKDAMSPTRWGLTMTALAPEELPKVFDTILWSFGGDVINPDGQTYFDSSESIEAGGYMQSLIRENVVPPDMLNWDFARVRDSLLKGETAMAAPYWNAAYSMIARSESPLKDNIKVALIPGTREPDGSIKRTVFEHGWALAINANSGNRNEAWKFIAYATGKRGGQIYARAGGTPARQSILSDPLLVNLRPEFPLVLECLKLARSEPSLPYYPIMIEYQNQALLKVLTLNSSPKAAFGESANQMRRITVNDKVNAIEEE